MEENCINMEEISKCWDFLKVKEMTNEFGKITKDCKHHQTLQEINITNAI